MRLIASLLFVLSSLSIAGQALSQNLSNHDKNQSDTLTQKTKEIKSIKSPEVKFNIGKASFKMDLSGRVQLRYDINNPVGEGETEKEFQIRRSRVKSKGHLFTEKLEYKFEYDFPTNSLLDAVLKWKITDNLELWAGQTKLPGNRERVISSQDLQFVDRSLLNSNFNIDRDLGVWVVHDLKFGDVKISKTFTISKGEGLTLFQNNPEPLKEGLSYTGRVEVFPLGDFEEDGAYTGPDLIREQTPKLAIGISYDYNNNAGRSNGHLGDYIDKSADLQSWIADAILKYKGFSYLGEYVNRKASDHNVNPSGEMDDNFYVGSALNNQVGYLFPYNFELATRYTKVWNETPGGNDLEEYTVVLSKYIIGHQIKIQTDASLQKAKHGEDQMIYRFQLELSF